jgi:uncharacterized coiled-coil protein SlyX
MFAISCKAGRNSLGRASSPLSALLLGVIIVWLGMPLPSRGQEIIPAANPSGANLAELARQVAELQEVVRQLQLQVRELQGRPAALSASAVPLAAATPSLKETPQAPEASPVPTNNVALVGSGSAPDPLRGTTVNFLFDGYYSYNFNDPIGRVNLLRAYDVSSNAFSLNQADIVLENAADPANGKRIGARVDLQFGQATETLAGNPSNEPRPDVYRNIFQAYGTYVLPLGSGLAFDFGKWSSSLGIEGNFTKDQINYSRSYWFDYLPFYHMGARLHYQVNQVLGLNYWITNGTQQTEPFNGYKDEMFGFVLQPTKNLNWTVNYYLGQEHPDFRFVINGPPNLPTFQGMPFEPIVNPPNGKLHIFDTYATWNATSKWTVAGEADYVIERLLSTSTPDHTEGGAGYLRYQLTSKLALAARGEYLADYGGLYTGKTQALKEVTATFEYRLPGGFLMRDEWRQDWSNQPYFLTSHLGVLKKSQNTATAGLVWWFGAKEGAW